MTIAATVQAIADFILTVGSPSPLKYSFGADDKVTQFSRDKYPGAVTLLTPETDGHTMARTVLGGSLQTTFSVTQWVIFAPIARELHEVMPTLITFLDNFNAQMAISPFFTNPATPSAHNLPRPMWRIMEIPFAGEKYWGIVFVYAVELNL